VTFCRESLSRAQTYRGHDYHFTDIIGHVTICARLEKGPANVSIYEFILRLSNDVAL